MQILMQRRNLRLISLIFWFYTASALSIERVSLMPMTLKSSAFAPQTQIPNRFTCDGTDVSPDLSWSNIPQNTKSLALIVEDPDVPIPAIPIITWGHWLLYNIPPSISRFPEKIMQKDLPAGALQGKNDWKQTGYRGPCPPIGRHRYFFKLYALDTELPDLNLPDKAKLKKAMDGHIIDYAELIGTYKRQ
jgi:Raf kinase inhibitor-like YbhB/YbcL family protein